MSEKQLETVYEALLNGDRKQAKQMLTVMVKESPNADVYYYGAFVAKSQAQAVARLRRALKEDPFHSGANRLLMQVEKQGADALKKARPAPPGGSRAKKSTSTVPELTREELAKKRTRARQRPRRSRSSLTLFGIGAFFLSISLSWLVLLLLGVGSGLINPVAGTLGGDDPITEYRGTPIADVRNPARLVDLPAAISTELPLGAENATGDIMRSGLLHEYIFRARSNSSIAVAVQFFSPFAQDVFPNVAILDPNDEPAGDRCRREIIIDDSTGAAFVCAIDISGSWRVRIFGRDGASSGVYVVTAEGIID